jgi:hypothetical protein
MNVSMMRWAIAGTKKPNAKTKCPRRLALPSRTYTHARTRARARTRAHTRARAHSHSHSRTHARTHAHTDSAHTHARTHAHTHARERARARTHAHPRNTLVCSRTVLEERCILGSALSASAAKSMIGLPTDTGPVLECGGAVAAERREDGNQDGAPVDVVPAGVYCTNGLQHTKEYST